MAVASRPNHSFSWFSALLFSSWFVHGVAAVATQHLQRIQDPNVIFDDSNGATTVYSPTTGMPIPQGLATDGSGSSFSVPAALWIAFCFIVGGPLLVAGFRGWRLTLGATIGLAAALASWSVTVNTLDNVGVSDLTLTACILVLFFMGFGLGLMDLTRTFAILVLGILGGLSVGIRVVLLRSGLLIPGLDLFFLNWLLIGVCGVAGSVLVLWKQRYGILSGCASTGAFLCGLGFDLIISQQSGMSRGLRYLIDRNSYHVLDTVTNGYSPPMTTVIILALSLGVTPAFAYAQWKVFKRPFAGTQSDPFIGSDWEAQEVSQSEETGPQRITDMPDTPTTEKLPSPLTDHGKHGQSS